MTSIGYASLQIIPSMRGFEGAVNRELSGVMAKQGRMAGEKAGQSASDGFGARIGGMSKYAKAAVVGVGVALGVGAVGIAKWGVSLAAANEQAQISFETMLGSGQKAKTFLDDLRSFAAETPFEFPELQTAASSLISAGIEADKVIPIMTTLGDVTAGMGTGSEGIKRATVALQQMQAAGKITGEDLNQLRDAGIPVYDLLANATGKAKSEIVALAQAGKLGKTELDQLMQSLETGGGLERFNGLMDKQSQSLSGLASSLKDNLGQGLATAMEPAVGQLKVMLPTVTDLAGKAMPLLGDGLVAAIDAGQDFARWVGPIAQDIGQHLLPVLEDLAEIAGNIIPDALKLAGGAIVGVQHVVGPLLDAVGTLTGFLADHEDVVLAVVAAYAAWKVTGLAADLGGSLVDGVKAATGSLADMREAIKNIAATRGVSEASATLGVLRSTLTAPVSGGMAAGGALAGIAIGATLAIKSLERSAEHGQKAAKAFIDSLNVDAGDSGSLLADVMAINDQIDKLSEQANRSGWDQFKQRINPFDKNTIDESEAAVGSLADQAAEYNRMLQHVYGAAKLLGTSSDAVDAWVKKLDLDPAKLGPKRLARAIGEARNAAKNGTPETDKLREAYKKMADETANSTDKIDAWKDALDTAMGKPRDLFDATTRYSEGLQALQQSLTEGGWGQFGTDTEAGRANRDALSGMVGNVQDLANAYADMGNNDKAAQAIKTGRDEIIEAGKAAGISEQQVGDYLDSLGLSEGTWKAQVELDGAAAAKTALDTLDGLLKNFDGKTAKAYVDLSLNAPWLTDTSWWSQLVSDGTKPWFLGGGGQKENRWGGMYQFAAGGMTQAHVAMGTRYKWAEPATGGEAFIPRNGDRARNESILSTVASDWMGGEFIPAKERAKRPRRGGSAPITIIAQGATARAVGDELMWSAR